MMRPVRALGVLLALVVLWICWRVPIIQRDIARYSAAAYAAMAVKGTPASSLTGLAVAVAFDEREAARAGGEREGSSEAVRERMVRVKTLGVPATTPSPLAPAPAVLAPAGGGEDAPRAFAMSAPLSPAERGYAALARHDRRSAAGAFREALAETPDDPRAPAWSRQLAFLEKRWSGSTYVFARETGASDLAVAPLLGGGQSGMRIAYALDPLAHRPLAIEARITAPNAGRRKGAQAALGLSWRLAPGAGVTLERLAGLGAQARGGWTLRTAGGAATRRPEGAHRWLDLSVYAEAGAVGRHDTAFYGAVQGRAGVGAALGDRRTLSAGLGGWASAQRDRGTVDRVDLGPTLALRVGGIEARAEYRLRAAGNASPGSGPALTLAAFF